MGRLRVIALAGSAWCAVNAFAVDWPALDRYQQTISRDKFDQLLSQVYCPSGAFTNYLTFTTNAVAVFSTPAKESPLFTLYFSASSLIPHPSSLKRIVLDPGHIGGEWARIEERFFVRGTDRPVQEAVLNLAVARLLKPQLEAAGATILFTKNNFEPVTDKRPEDFRAQAERDVAKLARFDIFPPLEREAARADAIRKRAETLFYRGAEIAARARRVNEELKPDITLCIHFNAVDWNERFELVDDNRLVVFVHGNYLPSELEDDEQKFRLMSKLLSRSHEMELRVAEALASALAKATGLPPVEYAPGGAAVRVGTNRYVYTRNLAANRLIDGPVVFLEPYYQNNRVVYERIQLGDYEGTRDIEKKSYRSIYREYADAVAEGLSDFIHRQAERSETRSSANTKNHR
jgi:hypothetical protein